jgi:hypothetical protein
MASLLKYCYEQTKQLQPTGWLVNSIMAVMSCSCYHILLFTTIININFYRTHLKTINLIFRNLNFTLEGVHFTAP